MNRRWPVRGQGEAGRGERGNGEEKLELGWAVYLGEEEGDPAAAEAEAEASEAEAPGTAKVTVDREREGVLEWTDLVDVSEAAGEAGEAGEAEGGRRTGWWLSTTDLERARSAELRSAMDYAMGQTTGDGMGSIDFAGGMGGGSVIGGEGFLTGRDCSLLLWMVLCPWVEAEKVLVRERNVVAAPNAVMSTKRLARCSFFDQQPVLVHFRSLSATSGGVLPSRA